MFESRGKGARRRNGGGGVLTPLLENSNLLNSNINITTYWALEPLPPTHTPPTRLSLGSPFLKTHQRIMVKVDPSRENSMQSMIEYKSWWLYILDQFTRIQRSFNTAIQTLCRVTFIYAWIHRQNGNEKKNFNWHENFLIDSAVTLFYVQFTFSRILSMSQVLTCPSYDRRVHARADQTVQLE